MFKALYRAYLRFLLNRYTRELQVLAAQRANDALAEQVLTREAEQVRARLLML
jgi:predicted NBD/HSP70 family sugar kinase